MTQYAVIHAVAGLHEGYSDTTCEFFTKRGFADKHILNLLSAYRKDKECVKIEHVKDGVDLTMTINYEDYHACTASGMTHDAWCDGEEYDDVRVEIIRIIEIDFDGHKPTTESRWLTWDQLDCCEAWDYFPLCMSLVARVSSEVTNNDESVHGLEQLTEFISSVYYRNHAFIDVDDYVMHAFRIPKPKNSDSYDEA
jgi:hypothetical protein